MPYEIKGTWRIELFNDYCILIVLYHMMCFTEMVRDSDARYHFVGSSCILFTGFNIVVNLFVLID